MQLFSLPVVIYPMINKYLNSDDSCRLFIKSNNKFRNYFYENINPLSDLYLTNYGGDPEFIPGRLSNKIKFNCLLAFKPNVVFRFEYTFSTLVWLELFVDSFLTFCNLNYQMPNKIKQLNIIINKSVNFNDHHFEYIIRTFQHLTVFDYHGSYEYRGIEQPFIVDEITSDQIIMLLTNYKFKAFRIITQSHLDPSFLNVVVQTQSNSLEIFGVVTRNYTDELLVAIYNSILNMPHVVEIDINYEYRTHQQFKNLLQSRNLTVLRLYDIITIELFNMVDVCECNLNSILLLISQYQLNIKWFEYYTDNISLMPNIINLNEVYKNCKDIQIYLYSNCGYYETLFYKKIFN